MAAAQADVFRGQLTADLHTRQFDALQRLLAGVAEHHLEAQAQAELGAHLGHAGVARQQQALGRANPQLNPLGLAQHPGALVAVRQQAARAVVQGHFADQPALAG